ncbi:TPA: hypothetical protein QC116_003135 [Bacillus thuringiensis]|nr:hypothetical protein [Bacillus thuringiensis]
MIKRISSRFEFRNIGQGMFYTGQIADFKFVYDCGSISGKKMINAAINEYKCEHDLKPGIKGKLNMLVLSHFDMDHVNGVTELLNAFHVDTVVIPYLYPIERLGLIVKYNNKKYRNLVKDPIVYFSQFNVKQIILLDRNYLSNQDQTLNNNFIKPSDSENLKIDNDDLLKAFDNLPDSDAKEEIKKIENLNHPSKQVQIKIKKRGSVIISDIWEFLFFNYDSTPDVLKTLTTCATVDEERLFDKQELLDLLENEQINIIKEQYNKMIKKFKNSTNIKNINNTSIVLNHMPINYEYASTIAYLNKKREETDLFPENHKITNQNQINSINAFRLFKESNSCTSLNYSRYTGTLLFGDINIGEDLEQITSFFDHKILELSIISVPHHGSKNNWDSKFLKILDTKKKEYLYPTSWVVSCGYKNNFGHPDQIVLNQFMKNNKNQLFINNELYAIHFKLLIWINPQKIYSSTKIIDGLKI